MVISKKKSRTDGRQVVYDISLDGTVVNALGMNVMSNTDGFNFKLPEKDQFRYTDENPYIGLGLNRNVKKGEKYTGFKADVAEFNDRFMRVKMGLGIDEVVDATINFSRKNYADYFPENPYPEDVKMVGNTIKSKKMPEYISDFLAKGIRLLLQNKGQEFLEEYYSYVEKIYNYQIPLKKIASKGKVKKTLQEYVEDCKVITKAGRPKSRQAWMELALKDNLKVDKGDTIYYINTGTSKSHSDVKKVKHYFVTDPDGSRRDIIKLIDKEYNAYKKEQKANNIPKDKQVGKEQFIKERFFYAEEEDEIVLNSRLLPREIIDSEEDFFCDGEFEYNVPKYVDQFNSRIKPLLVCFSKDIRDRIMITDPDKRPYFTEEESVLSSGEPNQPGDQDTYEQLMTMEDKEIRFWMRHPELPIPFVDECGMDWNKIKGDYMARIEKEKELGVNLVREEYDKAVNNLNITDFEEFLQGILPSELSRIVELDPLTANFVCKKYPDIVIGNVHDFMDKAVLERFEE